MRFARLLVVVVVGVALSCSSGKNKAEGDDDKQATPVNKGESVDVPVKKLTGTSDPSRSNDTPGQDKAKPPQKPSKPQVTATVPGSALRAWATKAGPGKRRVPSSKLPKAVFAELRTLAKKSDRDAQPSWVHVLTSGHGKAGPTVAFAYGYVEKDSARKFWFTTLVDENQRYTMRHTIDTHRSIGDGVTSKWDFGKMRDVDGDGVADVIIRYDYHHSRAKFLTALNGTILLASRGAAINLVRRSVSADNESPTSMYVVDSAPIWRWVTVDGQPALLFARLREDRLARGGGKKRQGAMGVLVADGDGQFVARAAHMVLAQRARKPGTLPPIARKLRAAGAIAEVLAHKGRLRCPGPMKCQILGDCPPCRFTGERVLLVGLGWTKDAAKKQFASALPGAKSIGHMELEAVSTVALLKLMAE